jgi:hypothetical protein
MAVKESVHPAPGFLADLFEHETGGLTLFPDRIEAHDDVVVASYRPDAQALRVVAEQLGLKVTVVAPKGAKKGIYTEHAADWVLPLIEIPDAVVAAFIVAYLDHRLKGWRAGSSARRAPVVRYREVERSADGATQEREIEGPAEDVMAWLRENRE